MSSYRANARETSHLARTGLAKSPVYGENRTTSSSGKRTFGRANHKPSGPSSLESQSPANSSPYSPACSPAPSVVNRAGQGGGNKPMNLANNYQHHPLLHRDHEDDQRSPSSGQGESVPSPSPSPSTTLPMFDRCRKVTVVLGDKANGMNGPSYTSRVMITTSSSPSSSTTSAINNNNTSSLTSATSTTANLSAEPIPPARRLRSPAKSVHPSVMENVKTTTSTTTTESVNSTSSPPPTTTTTTALLFSPPGTSQPKSPIVQPSANQVLNLTNIIGNEPLAQLLITLKEQNKSLVREIEDLRIKLEDAEGDLKIVRCQMRTISKDMDTVAIETSRDRLRDDNILAELAFYKQRVMLLERDLQSLLDEKEELLVSKADLQLKNNRLNEHLVTLLRSMTIEQQQQQQAGAKGDTLLYDIDRLYVENRYLKEKIKTEEDERRLLLDSLAKYQSLIDHRQTKEDARYRGVGAPRPKHIANTNGGDNDGGGEGVGQEDLEHELTSDRQTSRQSLSSGHHTPSSNKKQKEVERLITTDSIHSMEVSKANQLYLYDLLVTLYQESSATPRRVHLSPSPYRSPSSTSPYHCPQPQPSTSSLSPHPLITTQHTPDDLVVLDGRFTPSSSARRPRHMNRRGASEEGDNEDEEEEEEEITEDTSTNFSTSSATVGHSLSIERHLQALQADALADDSPTPVRGSPPSASFDCHGHARSASSSPRHRYHQHPQTSPPQPPSSSVSPYPSHKASSSGLF